MQSHPGVEKQGWSCEEGRAGGRGRRRRRRRRRKVGGKPIRAPS